MQDSSHAEPSGSSDDRSSSSARGGDAAGDDSERRWSDALRVAQAELDELRDRHAQERLLLEVRYQQSIAGGVSPLLDPDDEARARTARPRPPAAQVDPADPLDPAALHQRCMALEARLAVSDEEVAALRQSNARLLSSESRYRERADQLQSQLTVAQSSLHAQGHVRAQLAQLRTELEAMEAAMQSQVERERAVHADAERREEELSAGLHDIQQRLARKKDGWKREREEMRRTHEERERALKELMVAQLEQRDDAVRKAEGELAEVSAKHRREWQEREEQLFRAKEDVRTLHATIDALKEEASRNSHWQADCGRLEADVQRLTAAHARAVAEVNGLQERARELEGSLQQQVEVSDVSERYIEQLKLELREKDDAISRHSAQLSSMQALVEANQAAVQREQQQSIKALEVMQSELNGYREVHLSMVSLYDVQMQQMREQLQSVLVYVLGAEESGRKSGGGGHSGGGISARRVIDMMQAAMQQIAQQDLLIQAMNKHHHPSPQHRPPSAQPPPPQSASAPGRFLPVKSASSKERSRRGAVERKRSAAVDAAEAGLERLVTIPLTARISHLQLQLAHSEQQLASAHQQSAQHQAQADKDRGENAALHQRMHELQREVTHERTQLKKRERELEHRIKELQDVHRTEADWTALTRQLEDSQAALRSAKEELQRKSKLLHAAQQRQTELQAAVRRAQLEVEEREKRVQRLHQSAQKKDSRLAEAVKELDDLRLVHSHLKEEEQRRRLEVEEIAIKVRSLKDELARTDAAAKQAEVVADDRSREAAELRARCQRLESEQEQQHTDRLQWTRREEDLRREAEARDNGLLALREELAKAKEESAALERREQEQSRVVRGLQTAIEEQRVVHSRMLHFVRELLQPHLVRLRSAYAQLHRVHQRRVVHREQQRLRVEEERRLREPQADFDLSTVSAAASQAGLDLSLHEVQELMHAGRQHAERTEEDEREDEELHRRNRLLQEIADEWDAAFAVAAADAPRFSSAWSERIALLARRVFAEELRIARAEGQQQKGEAGAAPLLGALNVDDTLLHRYQQTVADVKTRLTEQHRSHASQVARYQSRLADLLQRLQRCRCGAAIRPSTEEHAREEVVSA